MRASFKDGDWRLTKLQLEVVCALERHEDGLTDEELSALPVFLGQSGSTIRTRRSELEQVGIVIWSGIRKNSRGKAVSVWKAASDWPL